MNKEEYDDRGFPFRDFLLKLILIVICVFLLLWFLPKFTHSNKNTCRENGTCISQKESFSKNMKKMKRSAISYFDEERVPKNDGDSIFLTLKDMKNKSIINIKNSNGIKYDTKKSYIKLTKTDKDYVLKISLKSNKKEGYKTIHLNNYSYCNVYLCEKDKSKEDKKDKDEVVEDTNDSNDYVGYSTSTVTKTKKVRVKYKKGYKYKYIKIIKPKFSSWTNWSLWNVTSCDTKRVSCSDESSTCLKKVQRYDKKVQTGTITRTYRYPKQELKYVALLNRKVCSLNKHIVVNNKLYRVSTDYKFTLVERNKYFSKIPNDSLYYHYEFVSKNHYNVYRYNGTITEESSSCINPVTVRVPIYNYINKIDTETVTEPVYKTTCYKSIKTRKLLSRGRVLIKWSKYNDRSLIKNGWILTNSKKRI